MDEVKGVGVLLAGGRGTRLAAGVPKAMVRFGSRTLLAHVLDRMRQLVSEIRVVAPAGMVLELPAGVVRVDDPPGDTGPLGALVAGLHAAPFDDVALVLPVDLPGVGRTALRELARLRLGAPASIVSIQWIPQPLVGWYTPAAAARLAELWEQGERSVTRAALAAGAVEHEAERLGAGGKEQWLNVNTPDDLRLANKVLAWD